MLLAPAREEIPRVEVIKLAAMIAKNIALIHRDITRRREDTTFSYLQALGENTV